MGEKHMHRPNLSSAARHRPEILDSARAAQRPLGVMAGKHSLRLLFGLLLFQFVGVAAAQQPTQAQANAIKQSCRSDYQSNCSSVPTGGRASLQCLQEHLVELSPACQAAVNAGTGGGSAHPPTGGPSAPSAMSPRQEMALMRQSCGGDFRAYCRGVPLGGGRAMACLAENQSRLSPACKGALAEAHGAR